MSARERRKGAEAEREAARPPASSRVARSATAAGDAMQIARRRAVYEFAVRAPERPPSAKTPAGRPRARLGGAATVLRGHLRAARNRIELHPDRDHRGLVAAARELDAALAVLDQLEAGATGSQDDPGWVG